MTRLVSSLLSLTQHTKFVGFKFSWIVSALEFCKVTKTYLNFFTSSVNSNINNKTSTMILAPFCHVNSVTC